jgi:hypothetical protein
MKILFFLWQIIMKHHDHKKQASINNASFIAPSTIAIDQLNQTSEAILYDQQILLTSKC